MVAPLAVDGCLDYMGGMPQAHRLKLPTASASDQVANKEQWNATRSKSDADFYTLGYTGRKINEILNTVVEAGVRSVVDIRQHAVSMYRPELSKSNLQQLVIQHGLLYYHLPELGVPRDIRAKAINAGSRGVIWEWYDHHVVEPYLTNLHRFFNAIEHPVALMCVEVDPLECHRHRLFLALEERGLRGFDL